MSSTRRTRKPKTICGCRPESCSASNSARKRGGCRLQRCRQKGRAGRARPSAPLLLWGFTITRKISVTPSPLGVGVRFPIVLMRLGSAYLAKAAALADQGKPDRHTPKTSGDGGELALGAHYGGFEGGFLAARDGQIDL